MGTTPEELQYSNPPARICGQDEQYAVDVIRRTDGRHALVVDHNNPISWDYHFRYLDMNAGNGGVARGTSITNAAWVDVFSYTGSGYLASFLLNIETFAGWRVRVVVDGTEVLLGSNGILTDDVSSDSVYDLDDTTDQNGSNLGISKGSHDRLIFTPALRVPIKFNSSISIKLKRDDLLGSKKFQAGLVAISEGV